MPKSVCLPHSLALPHLSMVAVGWFVRRGLDMTPFQGRLLHVLPAKRKPGEDLEDKPDKEVSSTGMCLRLALGVAALTW